ncbi:hypothetical protein GJAV_G00195090 [Gymnothorax javanicus]|nr:hypothetical protein GJAV_G00195090 [Gymnothorax javanicus]
MYVRAHVCVSGHFTMITLCGHILLTALLQHLSAVADSTRVVYGYIGHSVTLPCKYDAGYYGALHMCWGRGYLPSRGCNNEIISTDGQKVTYRQSRRYDLTGNLKNGDVSLTIANTVGSDAGIYGCRVQIPGWFNDQKEAVHLILRTAPTTTTTTTTTTTQAQVITERETTVNPTTAPTTTQTPVTTERETTVNPTTAPTTTQAPVTTERETTVNPTTAPTKTQAPVTTERETTVNPTTAPTSVEGPVEKTETDTTQGPTEVSSLLPWNLETANTRATPEWSFGPKTSNPTTSDTVTRVQPRLQSSAVPTHWLTDLEAEQKPTSTIQAEGDLDNLTTTLTSDWTPDNSTSPAEEARVFSPPLLWILGPTLLLAAILVTAIVLHMRRKHKAGSFELPREPNKPSYTFLMTPDLPMTPDPALELDSKTETEMETMVPQEEGENAERCP